MIDMLTSIFVIIFEPVTICAIGYMLFSANSQRAIPVGYLIGFALAGVGMLGEVFASVHDLRYGFSAEMAKVPLWVGKDFGYFFIAATYAWRRYRGWRDTLISPNVRQER